MDTQPSGNYHRSMWPSGAKYTIITRIVIGAIVIVFLIVVGVVIIGMRNNSSFNINPGSGKEGTEITIVYPKAPSSLSGSATVKFYDAGEHGWYMVSGGAAVYVAYDSTKGLTYSAPATATGSNNNGASYTATVPQGICGFIIQSDQATPAPPKVLDVSIAGPDGTPIPGTHPTKFNLICDKYTLKAKITANPDKVLPDGASQSTITANLSVTGPAQVVIGQKITKPTQPIILVSPLGLVMVHFNTSLGTIAPNPANVKTDLSGDAVVTLTSMDAGIAKVQAVASGIGDAIANVYFEPKITGVQENFVQPNSPTNYQISTIPANPKDLTFDWEIIRPAGPVCGSLTGPASGLGESMNGFFHGLTSDFPNGCDETYEFATQIKVTVTDKDGQSDSKTFSARALEGQGVVKLP